MQTGCMSLKLIMKHFWTLISDTLKATPSVGVDITREERWVYTDMSSTQQTSADHRCDDVTMMMAARWHHSCMLQTDVSFRTRLLDTRYDWYVTLVLPDVFFFLQTPQVQNLLQTAEEPEQPGEEQGSAGWSPRQHLQRAAAAHDTSWWCAVMDPELSKVTVVWQLTCRRPVLLCVWTRQQDKSGESTEIPVCLKMEKTFLQE